MLKNNCICLVISFFILVSCAHKSGHQKDYLRTSSRGSSGYSKNKLPSVSKSSRSGKLEGNQVFQKYHSAVFMVFTSDGSKTYQGSGFFINDRGLAVSNYHVFQHTTIGEEAIKLENDDVNFYQVAEVYEASEEDDFILFRVDCGRTNYIPIAGNKPKTGDKVFAIGSPRGLENTFSSGEVSQWRDKNLMQISALIDHGSSGGALINEYGEVVGITSGTFYEGSQANLNYAWSIEVVKPYISFK